MNVSRFILENTAARLVGIKVPPYWLFRHPKVTKIDSSDYDSIRQMSDEELVDTIKTNANGVPM